MQYQPTNALKRKVAHERLPEVPMLRCLPGQECGWNAKLGIFRPSSLFMKRMIEWEDKITLQQSCSTSMEAERWMRPGAVGNASQSVED